LTGHHPPHIYLSDTCYIITAATLHHAPFLASEAAKTYVRDSLRSLVVKFGIKLYAWVVLDDHYHLLLKTHRGEDLPRFVGRLHGSCSHRINLLDGKVGRQVWHNYWDTCIRTERDFWVRFNYIHYNPVKHGYVQHMEDWLFSSYRHYLKEKGRDWLYDCWLNHPVTEFAEADMDVAR